MVTDASNKSPESPLSSKDQRSIGLRKMILTLFATGRQGHVGSALSLVEILRVLYDDVLRYNSTDPQWEGRDRFILSKGHGCMALYVILAEKGFFEKSLLEEFCAIGGRLGGHAEHSIPGVEVSTGSLGHGLSIGIGMALHARHKKKQNRVFVIIGDGEANEGSIWEAAMCASKHQLNNLIVIVDYNQHQAYGCTSIVQPMKPFAEKWEAFGFHVLEVDGHDVPALQNVFSGMPQRKGKPTAVICHTVKGKGIPSIENNPEWHYRNSTTQEEITSLLNELNAPHA